MTSWGPGRQTGSGITKTSLQNVDYLGILQLFYDQTKVNYSRATRKSVAYDEKNFSSASLLETFLFAAALGTNEAI